MRPDIVSLSVGVAAYAGAATLVIWLRPLLARYGAVTRPGPCRVGRAVPRGGGLAIVLATVVVAAPLVWLFPEGGRLLGGWALPAVGIAAVSLRDDFRTVPPVVRLAVHVAAAVAAVWAVGPLEAVSFGELGLVSLGLVAWPLSLLWIVGMTNTFNFMDGIDGIAGLTAVVAGAILTVAASAVGCGVVTIIATAFAAAAAGFLSWNWPPARIFMGDVGSTFCGFTIATLPLVVPSPGRMAVVPVVMLAMWPFIFDASTTLLKRMARRENILETHESHIYQRLVIAGWSHRRVATLYGLLAVTAGGFAAASIVVPSSGLLFATAAGGMVFAVPVVLLSVATNGKGLSPSRPPSPQASR